MQNTIPSATVLMFTPLLAICSALTVLPPQRIVSSALNTLAIDEPLEYARLYLDGNLQMWVDAEDSLEL